MEELLEFINYKFEDLHKAKKPGFGTILHSASRKNRAQMREEARDKIRTTTLLERRNISKMEMCLTPNPAKPAPMKSKRDDRVTLLKKWKAEKEERLKKEKAHKKPIFKVCSVSNVGFPSININNNSTNVHSMTSSFAPKNFVFKAPENIVPIKMELPKKELITRSRLNINQKPVIANNNPFLRVTRSQKSVTSSSVALPQSKSKRTTSGNKNTNSITSSNESVCSKILQEQSHSSKTKGQTKMNLKKTLKLVRQEAILDESTEENYSNIDHNIQLNDLVKQTSKRRKFLRNKNISDDSKFEKVNAIEECALFGSEQSQNSDEKKKCGSNKKRTRKSTKKQSNDENNEPLTEDKITINVTLKQSTQENIKNTSKKRKSRKSLAMNQSINEELKIGNSIKTKSTRSEDRNCSSSSLSTAYSIRNSSLNDSSLSDSVFETSLNDKNELNRTAPTVYVSPFVTTSRGKGSAKKENVERKARGIAPFTEHSTPEKMSTIAGAAYFHKVLDNVIEQLKAECEVWYAYKRTGEGTEDATGMIDVAIGQANLLMEKKFQQFRNLINNCQNGDGERLITCADLQGFWDMVYMQVENLEIRFKRLTDLKNNNWEEFRPTVKDVAPVRKKKVPAKSTTTVPTRSNLRAAIREARIKSMNNILEPETNIETVFNGGFFIVKSPNRITPDGKTPSKKRKSMLVSVLSTEAKKKGRQLAGSPAEAMLRVSQRFKSVGKNVDDMGKVVSTPGKSILKNSANANVSYNVSKVVLFKDDDDDCREEDRLPEVNLYNQDLISFDTPEKDTIRKSKRLVRK